MRTRDGRLKILDFGLARLDPRRPRVRPLAVHRHAARRRCRHAGLHGAGADRTAARVDPRADVFAFGVLMYEYACGVHPFAGATPLATIARVLESDARAARRLRCPTLAAAVVRRGRALPAESAPDDRFGSAAEIVGALKAIERARRSRRHSDLVADASAGRRGAVPRRAAVLAWQIKEWVETPSTVALFIALGGGGDDRRRAARPPGVHRVGCNRARLTRRTPPARAGAIRAARSSSPRRCCWSTRQLMAGVRALPAVFALSLALGIALAALVLEPATTARRVW